jgi:hypothetical protein
MMYRALGRLSRCEGQGRSRHLPESHGGKGGVSSLEQDGFPTAPSSTSSQVLAGSQP